MTSVFGFLAVGPPVEAMIVVLHAGSLEIPTNLGSPTPLSLSLFLSLDSLAIDAVPKASDAVPSATRIALLFLVNFTLILLILQTRRWVQCFLETPSRAEAHATGAN